MASPTLTPYWIRQPIRHGPIGFGVTAYSLDDAFTLVRVFGYGEYLPANLASLAVIEDVTIAALDESHVVANMGPITVRGMWYPFVAIGVPAWAEERIAENHA